MADKNESKEKIIIEFETNADDASKDVGNLSTSITKTEEATKKATKANKDLTESSEQSSKATKDQTASFEDLGGGIGDAIGQVKALGQQFIKLLANPIVLFIAAIVGALATLYKAFVSTDAGAEKMEQAMAGISATIDVLRDRVLKAGGAIAKFFSGDFKGALVEARSAVSGIGDEIATEFRKAAEATAILQELEDTMRNLSVSRARLNRDLVQSRELLQDENASYAEKKKALREVGQAEQEQTALEIDAAKRKLAAMKAIDEQSDVSDEKRNAQAELEKQIFGLQEESARNQIKLNKQNAALDREESERKKALAEERKRQLEEERKVREALSLEQEEERKRASELTDTYYEDQQQKKLDHEMAMADIAAKQREIDFNNQKEIDAKALQAKKENQQALLTGAEQLIANVQKLAGKNKAIQKAAIIADGAIALGKAGVNTAEAVTKDLAKGAPFSAPLVALDIAVGATSAAAIISSTSKALQAVGGGSIGGAPSSPTIPTGVNASPQTGFQASSENQIATSINQANQAPQIVKAYVVGSDVTDQQTLDAKLVGENSFGGSTPG